MYNQANQGAKANVIDRMGIMSVIKGIAVSYIITIPTFILFAVILVYTDFPEKYIPAAVVITTLISLLTAGSTATRNLRSRGWLNGAIVGFVYMLVLYLTSSVILKNFSIDRYTVTMLIIGMLVGAIGGIIGINFKRSSSLKRGSRNT